MSNKETNAFLSAGLPPGIKKISGLELGLYLIICHRFDTREFASGKTNKGYLKSYPGMDLFINVTGMSRSAIEVALGKLKAKGLITQVEKGYRTNRACYVPTYSISLLANPDSVAYRNTLENEVSSSQEDSVSNTDRKSRVDEEKVSSTPVTISTVSSISTNKYNLERFISIILNSLPERLRTLSPGTNYEKLLDECDELGIADDVRRVISTNRWDNVQANPGGIVAKIIKDAIERKRSGHLVIAPNQVTYTPPPYVEEVREQEPISLETLELIEATKRKMKGFGSIPE